MQTIHKQYTGKSQLIPWLAHPFYSAYTRLYTRLLNCFYPGSSQFYPQR
jgi:hypothetical protein